MHLSSDENVSQYTQFSSRFCAKYQRTIISTDFGSRKFRAPAEFFPFSTSKFVVFLFPMVGAQISPQTDRMKRGGDRATSQHLPYRLNCHCDTKKGIRVLRRLYLPSDIFINSIHTYSIYKTFLFSEL